MITLAPWATAGAAVLAAIGILAILEEVWRAAHHDHRKGHR